MYVYVGVRPCGYGSYHSNYGTRYKLEFDLNNHCIAVCEALQTVSKEFKYQEINVATDVPSYNSKDIGWRFIPYLTKFGDSLAYNGRTEKQLLLNNTRLFDISLNSLNEWRIINDECDYIKKNNNTYQRFKESKFYADFSQKLRMFFNGEVLTGVDRETISYGSGISFQFNKSWHEYFELIVYNGYMDSDGYRGHASLFSQWHYRRLTHEEMSVLAILLKEDFPNYTSIGWDHYIYQNSIKSFFGTKEIMIMKSQITPIINNVPREIVKPVGYRDLY
ncbi:MAG: hypothetical protein IKK74_11350 [Clostridia bacterium]|nr:hypothetical protein [Clostridia bacterium]